MANPELIERANDYDDYVSDYLVDWGDGKDPELVFSDAWQMDCPEDLSWCRYISGVFYAGVKFGKAGGE